MFLSKEVVSIIFRLLNFFGFAFIAAYLFRKHILPGIKKAIAKKHAFFEGLAEEHTFLLEENITEEREIENQAALFETLKQKIAIWNNARKHEKDLREKECTLLKEKLKTRFDIQVENQQQQRILQELFPRVISKTYTQLHEKFSHPEATQKYLNDLMGYIKKSSNE